ncbi:MAG: hypothetical protein U0638_14110 [Phycisphaerales bacterium]
MTRTPDEASELTQAFFSEVIVGRRLFERADSNRGRLRSLIRTAVRRFHTDQWRSNHSKANVLTISALQLDREESLLADPQPDDAFDRRWALSLFEEAMHRCERHFSQGGKRGHWLLFETRILGPAIHGTIPPSCAEAAELCGFASAADAAAAMQTVKRRLDLTFREVVAETLDCPQDVADELRLVRSLLSARPS